MFNKKEISKLNKRIEDIEEALGIKNREFDFLSDIFSFSIPRKKSVVVEKLEEKIGLLLSHFKLEVKELKSKKVLVKSKK